MRNLLLRFNPLSPILATGLITFKECLQDAIHDESMEVSFPISSRTRALSSYLDHHDILCLHPNDLLPPQILL